GLKTQSPSGAAALDADIRLRAEPDKILDHGARFELPSEVIGEIRDHTAIDIARGEAPTQIAECRIECLLHHQPEVLIRVCLCELRDSAAEHIHGAHTYSSDRLRAGATSSWNSHFPLSS